MNNSLAVDNLSTFPPRIIGWLYNRGLTESVLKKNKIWWNGHKIVIPVFGADGAFLFNKYRRDPVIDEGPKYAYDAGAKVVIYNQQSLLTAELSHSPVIITEGEFDALLLESKGFTAVSSTGGAGSFQEEWAKYFSGIPDVYVCFDNDKAGEEGKMKVCRLIPHAKIIPLPSAVGEHGDITDFFKLGKTVKDFEILMSVAFSPTFPPEPKRKRRSKINKEGLAAAKLVPLQEFITLDGYHKAKCPFHPDGTPSLHVYPDNRWFCFGCGIGGDVVDFVMKLESISMKEAIEKILHGE